MVLSTKNTSNFLVLLVKANGSVMHLVSLYKNLTLDCFLDLTMIDADLFTGIIGGSCGFLLIIGTVALVTYWWRRRRAKSTNRLYVFYYCLIVVLLNLL